QSLEGRFESGRASARDVRVQHSAVAGVAAAAAASVQSCAETGAWREWQHCVFVERTAARSRRGNGQEDHRAGEERRSDFEIRSDISRGSYWAAAHRFAATRSRESLDRRALQSGGGLV